MDNLQRMADLEQSFPMGEHTNKKIGGVEDWQNVGQGEAFPTPPLGPVARAMKGEIKVSHGGEDGPVRLPPIDAKSTGGVVGKPQYATYEKGYEKKVSLNHDGGINPGTSGINLSAKFKNPNVKQDVPEKGKNQYED